MLLCSARTKSAGRAANSDVRIIDFVDTGFPAMLRMWDKRQRSFRAMGCSIRAGASAKEPSKPHSRSVEHF
jgi:hypothetical protein